MADPGYVDLPSTAHFSFEYDQTLDEAAATALGGALAATAEKDYDEVSAWFGGIKPEGLPFTVKINQHSATQLGSNNGNNEITIDTGITRVVSLPRMVLVAEFSEIFMVAQNSGWNRAASHGEALSQAASFVLYPADVTEFPAPQAWLDKPDPRTNTLRPDFVSHTDPTDRDEFSYGCGVLFLYFLSSQLGFTMRAIVQAASDTLEGVYQNLTQGSNAFPQFAAVLRTKFPPGVDSGLVGSTNPFPIPTTGEKLSTRQYLAKNPLGTQSLRQRVESKNLGNLRALLNSDRPASYVTLMAAI